MEDLFESRSDIEKAMRILQEWMSEHPNDSNADYAEELLNKLDLLHMVW